MNSVNKTLYIPLYGKALVSRRGILLRDPKAEEVWEKEGFPLKGKSASKWLAFCMAMRARVMDEWTEAAIREQPEAAVLHLGCGLDSRCLRVRAGESRWYDLDFPEVIRERKTYFAETETYCMVAADLREKNWLDRIPENGEAIVVMEGISMYFRPEELAQLLKALKARFTRVRILMDCYSVFAAKASRYKNPINDVGVTEVYGLDSPEDLAKLAGLAFRKEHDMTPTTLIRELEAMERIVFSNLYAGAAARSFYHIYEFESEKGA